MNLHSALAAAATRWPARTALIDPDGSVRLSYEALFARVARLAAGLAGLGLRPGDRVAMLVTNSWEYVTAFFGASAAGLIIVPMNIRLLEDELAHMVRDSGARLLIIQESLLLERPALAAIPELGMALVRASAGATARRFESIDAAPLPLAATPGDAVASLQIGRAHV